VYMFVCVCVYAVRVHLLPHVPRPCLRVCVCVCVCARVYRVCMWREFTSSNPLTPYVYVCVCVCVCVCVSLPGTSVYLSICLSLSLSLSLSCLCLYLFLSVSMSVSVCCLKEEEERVERKRFTSARKHDMIHSYVCHDSFIRVT